MEEQSRPISLPNGSLVWKMGMLWGILSPDPDGTYSKEHIRYIPYAPEGITDIPQGRGSFKRSLKLIGVPPTAIDTEVNMGWTTVHIFTKDGQPIVEAKGGGEAAHKRWSRRQLKMNDNYFTPNTIPTNNPEPNIDLASLTTSAHEGMIHEKAHWEWLRSEVYIRDKGICWVCKEFVLLRDYDLGHLVDRTNGGADNINNCAVMHNSCNISKPRHKTLAEATSWQLTPRTIHTHFKIKPISTDQISLIS